MKYALVSGDELTKFEPVVFVYNEGEYEVLCENMQRRQYFSNYLKEKNNPPLEDFVSTFSYLNVTTGDVTGDAKTNIDAIREKFLGKKDNSPAIISGKMAIRPDKFEPDAVDADNDGRVQDGTPFERPSTPNKPNAPTSRAQRRRKRAALDKSITTDENNDEFKKAKQGALARSVQRAKELRKPANKVYNGRQREVRQRRRILDGSGFAGYSGIRRLFKSRDDAYDEVKQSTIKTLADMREKALAGRLKGKYNRRLDPAVVEYFQKRTPEQIWDDLEKTALKLHDEVAKMPIEVRTKGDLSGLLISQGLLGDPKNRVKRDDMKTPWVIGLLAEHGHTLTDEDMRILERNGLLVGQTGRGETYESLREILEQGMGFNGGLDRKGRPVYGYYVTPSPERQRTDAPEMTDIGRRLGDLSNGPNLPGYSNSALVRVRDSVKDRSGYTFGDSLRNGILPRRNGEGEDKDTVLAVVHDRDFTNFKTPERDSELREIQQEYLLNLLEWNLSGDSSYLTKNDYIEAVMPFDVTPDEIDEMVIASDRLSVFRQDLDDAMPTLMALASRADLNGEQYGDLLAYVKQQASLWNELIKRPDSSELASFDALDPDLKAFIQAFKGQQLKLEGEKKGIKMNVGPALASSPANLQAAADALLRRFNP